MKIDLRSINSFIQQGQRPYQEDARFPDADSIAPMAAPAFFIVCDGVGGSIGGNLASRAVADSFGRSLSGMRITDTFTDDDFAQALSAAYDDLDRAARQAGASGMSTTLTFVAFHNGGIYVAHIGDSRVYQIRPGSGILYRTEDHSLVNALLRSGNVSPEDALSHPKANVITRSMTALEPSGERAAATVYNITDVAAGDYFLLCTDGVVHCINDTSICSILSTDTVDINKMARIAALARESSDNNTATLISIYAVERSSSEECDMLRTIAEQSDERVATTPLPRMMPRVHEIAVENSECIDNEPIADEEIHIDIDMHSQPTADQLRDFFKN